MEKPLGQNFWKRNNKKRKIQFLHNHISLALTRNIKYYYFLSFFSLFFIFFSSCSIEKKLAEGFLKDPPEINIQLITPDIVYKFNHKGEKIPGFDTISETLQDSALYVNSMYIQYVDDSIFLEKYVNNFIDELRNLGFRVYLDSSLDSVLSGKPQSYFLNMSQIQLDEYIYPIEDSEMVYDTVYYKSFSLNSVDVSAWLELSKMNAAKPVKTVLYSSFTASDGYNGKFYIDPFTGNVKYNYYIDSLRVKDIYDLAAFSGRKHAAYLFDFFLNQFVDFHMPQGIEMQGYLHYNRSRKTLQQAEEDRFEVLESK